MVAAVKACGSFQTWLDKRDVDASAAGAAADQEEGHTHHEELDNKLNKWDAFEDKGDQPGQFIRAADYDDNWFDAEDSVFNVFYVCSAGPTWG
eukprot:13239358-Alexandrium_andersonii.AAC.1